MILVAGATGALGLEICRKLAERGERVRALVRSTSSPDRVSALKSAGVETVQGDLKDAASLASACRGADTVISTVSTIVTSQAGDSFESTDGAGNIALVDAARAAGAKQFIFVSFDTSSSPDAPLVRAKRDVEAHLVASGMTYTILHPALFMESWLGPMLFADPATHTAKQYGDGTRPAGYVTVPDVAEVAVRCVGNPKAQNRSIAFAAEEMTQREAHALFGEVFGGRFDITEIPEAALEAQWNAAPDPFSKTFSSLMLGVARGIIRGERLDASEFPMQWTGVRQYIETLKQG